jgi:hypothetical protein
MLDGAPSIGDPELADVFWYSPVEIFERVKLPAWIEERVRAPRFSEPFIMERLIEFGKTEKSREMLKKR